MATNVLGGAAEVSINSKTIPSTLLSEVTVEITEGTRERTTLGGKFSKPSGVLDTAQVSFTMYLPSMDYLKNIFPSKYNAPTAPQTTGNVIIGSDSCATVDAGPVNIHYTCDATDDNDIHIFNGQAMLNFNPTFNDSDDLTIEVTVFAQPDEDGNVVRFGTGDLTAASVWDAATEATIDA